MAYLSIKCSNHFGSFVFSDLLAWQQNLKWYTSKHYMFRHPAMITCSKQHVVEVVEEISHKRCRAPQLCGWNIAWDECNAHSQSSTRCQHLKTDVTSAQILRISYLGGLQIIYVGIKLLGVFLTFRVCAALIFFSLQPSILDCTS